jgi:hypothetical protein
MARPYAKTFTSIWNDRDFTALPERAQRLYWLMYTQAHLSYAGVVPFTAKRWAGLASDSNAKALERALAELEAVRFVVHDDSTEEVLIRTFIRWDGVLKSPNICVAMVKDYCAVLSPKIRAAIAEEFPDSLPDPLLKRFPEGFPEPFNEEIAEPRSKGSPKGTPDPSNENPLRATKQQRQRQPNPDAPASNGSPPPPQSEPVPATPASTLDGVVELTMRRRGKYQTASRKADGDGWLEKARAGIRAQLEPDWQRIVSQHPDWDDQQVDEALRPDLQPDSRRLAVVPPPPLEPDPDCPWCEGTGVVIDEHRQAFACECRHRSAS